MIEYIHANKNVHTQYMYNHAAVNRHIPVVDIINYPLLSRLAQEKLTEGCVLGCLSSLTRGR